jgi:uncharacterized lipoprotein
MNKSLLLILVASLILSGCASTPLTLNYAPSSTLSVEGQVAVGDFKYLPGQLNDKVQPNQIRNTAIGSVVFEKNIDEYIETALFLESRFVGIKLNDKAQSIHGEINEFLIDDLGFSIDWTLDIRYVLDGCYDETHVLNKKTDKFGDVFGNLNEVIKLNVEMLLDDAAFQTCISGSSGNETLVSQAKSNTQNTVVDLESNDAVILPKKKSQSMSTDSSDLPSVKTRYPDLVDGINSRDTFIMREAAKRAGEQRAYSDKGVINACVGVLSRASESVVSKKDKIKVDGIAWCALNVGNARAKSAVDALNKLASGNQPKKITKHANHALKMISG